MTWVDPYLQRFRTPSGDRVVRLGVPQLDAYLEFLAVRARPSTVLAVAYDLKVFFTVVGKPAGLVTAVDVLGLVTGACQVHRRLRCCVRQRGHPAPTRCRCR